MALRIPNSAIFVCDIQEKFRNAIHEFDKVVLTSRKVLRAAGILDIPVVVTTQNRARLGDTIPELSSLYTKAAEAEEGNEGSEGKAKVIVDADKTRFSMWTDDVKSALSSSSSLSSSPLTAVIIGIESHICVTQTALDMLADGHAVYVLADGVSSSNPEEVPIALARLRTAGAIVTTSESWMYETMGDASIPQFRNIIGLVKDTSADTKTALSSLLSKI
ncbi:isochorismatase domain-containing protein [Ophiostoma piceae UAMH 11346]|uniref:Isochorismatase domain-containing protein n=1 Tax=Ophiostoma piceae (strain UAMH 11346) TaxID=1262450 RepID=S3D1Z6_OPHP1|nr:isochorismatase domain-containing protein [Ophiostoma piceae UAMH 11346]